MQFYAAPKKRKGRSDPTIVKTTCPKCGDELQRRKGNLRMAESARRYLLTKHAPRCRARAAELAAVIGG